MFLKDVRQDRTIHIHLRYDATKRWNYACMRCWMHVQPRTVLLRKWVDDRARVHMSENETKQPVTVF